MAMNIRPDEKLAEALRKQAEAEGRPQSTIVLDAVREYVDRRARRAKIMEASRLGAERYAVALKALGDL